MKKRHPHAQEISDLRYEIKEQRENLSWWTKHLRSLDDGATDDIAQAQWQMFRIREKLELLRSQRNRLMHPNR